MRRRRDRLCLIVENALERTSAKNSVSVCPLPLSVSVQPLCLRGERASERVHHRGTEIHRDTENQLRNHLEKVEVDSARSRTLAIVLAFDCNRFAHLVE